MTPILVHVQPWDTIAAARIDVRACSALEGEAFGINGTPWLPSLVERPQMSIEIMSPDISGRVLAGRARFALDLDTAAILATQQLKWIGAAVKIYSAAALAWPAITEFDGEITDFSIDLNSRVITINAEVSSSLLEKPLLTAEFGGAGGADGDAAKRGTLKPAGFGLCENIQPVWFDSTNNIGMIDGYANCTAITKLMEGASDLGTRVADYANYAALAAAIVAHTVPPGRWASCVAAGLVGLGAPPEGIIGVNATFGSNRLGAMMSRMIQTHAGVSSGLVDSASFTALDTALPYDAHFWTDNQTDVKSLCERLARSGNSTVVLTFQRKVAVIRAVASASVAVLDRSGKQLPRCIDWKSLTTLKPTWRIKGRAARPANVLTFDQVNYVDTIIDRGAYVGATVYRAGNVVWLADKSSWLYVNATAGSGNAPPTWPTTSNSYWTNLTAPLNATAIGVTAGGGSLFVLGSFTTLTGNSIVKAGGTHGAYQGGVAGNPLVGACYVSASVFTGASWVTTLALDDDATNYVAAAAGMPYSAIFTYGSGGSGAGTIGLYAGSTLIGGSTVSVSSVTDASRMVLAYDGTKVAVIFDGVIKISTPAAADQKLWPKVLDYHNSGASGYTTIDIQFGPFTQNNWSAFGGDGLPEGGATVSDNRLRNSSMVSTSPDAWWGTMTRTAGVAANGDPDWFARTTTSGGGTGFANSSERTACAAGDVVFVSALTRAATPASGTLVRFTPNFYKADGTSLSTLDVDLIATTTTWLRKKSSFTVPALAASYRMAVSEFCPTGASMDMAQPRFASTELQADVTALNSVAVEIIKAKTIAADYTGTITGVLVDVIWSAAVTRGGTSIKALDGTTYALSGSSGGTFAVDNTNGSSTKGQVSISAMTANTATADLTITVDGIAQPKITLKLEKVLGAPPGSSASVKWTTGEFVGINTTSYTAVVSAAKTIAVTSGQTLYGTAPLSFRVSGGGGVSRGMTAKWQYAVAGSGSWNDFAAGVASTYDGTAQINAGYPDYTYTAPSDGYIEVTQSKASLSAGSYDIRLVALDSATGRTCTLDGTATVTAS